MLRSHPSTAPPLQKQHSNADESNSAVEVYLQVGIDERPRTMVLELVAQALTKPAYHQLRTVEQLEEPALLKKMQEKDLDEELKMTSMEGYVPTSEERAWIESLLCIENLRETVSAIQDDPHIKSEAAVLALLRGTPDEAKVQLWATFAILLFPVGIPLLYSVALVRTRKLLLHAAAALG